ncbi:hypothetical protein EIP91_011833 [Steccherinum ochraceum]|uniref:Uncharacterized protein n=1 Tax=Steccherinum ochraceum TaxID=92696 RepID=A0A4R0RR48_9APHY|nr:hypothetical protein EIP91_011833 [Steccherinum ochraceum]
MSSHHRRSRSRDSSHSRSRSPEADLPYGAEQISESDYFLKSDEFRIWLKDEKRKYLDELSGDKARKYFRKFVKAWNRGKLTKSLYAGVDNQPASSQTAYKWSFASKASKADNAAVSAVREEVGAATYERSSHSRANNNAGPSTSRSRLLGPTLPSQSDLTLLRESQEEQEKGDRDLKRKRDRRDEKDRIEDMVGPKAVGKEALLEKKRAKRDADKSFREKGDEGLELDEDTLMGAGGSDSFKAQIARRDAARKRWEEKKFGGREDRDASTRERSEAIRQKDKDTMDMFMQLAKAKYG